MNSSLNVTFSKCQRCTQTHVDLVFKPLNHPADDYKYFAMCPNTQQPVLMRVVSEVDHK